MSNIKKIWTQIRGEIAEFHLYGNKEVGCNICTNDGEKFYTADYVVGDVDCVYIPNNPYSIGDFHTHVSGDKYAFSVDDIVSAYKNKTPIMFISDGFDVFGFDLRRYSRSLAKCKRRIDFRKIAKKINEKLEIFYYDDN